MERGSLDENLNQESKLDIGMMNDLVTNIALGEYALVVGPEVIMNEDSYNCNHSEDYILPYVIDKMNDKREKNGRRDRVSKDYKSFTELSEEYETSEIKKCILEVLKSRGCDNNADVDVETKRLLQSGLFRSIIVTTFDSHVEDVLREKWGDNVTIVNLWNTIGREQKIRKHSYAPTLFYAFGKADYNHPENSKFVISDVDRLKTMEHLMKICEMSNLIEEKKFIAIGNRMDDWLFRFFWFVVTSGCEDKEAGNKVVRSFENNSDSERNLRRYLKRINVIVDDTMNPKKFIKELNDYSSNTIKSYLDKFNRSGQVFISYSHDDLPVALNIYKYLQDNDINTWMDIRLEKEATRDGYNNDINVAINNSRIFIILLSKEVAKRMENRTGGYLIDTEWKKIIGALKDKKTLLPVAITGYNERDDYHTQIFEKEKFPETCQSVSRLDVSNNGYLPLENLRNRIKNLLNDIR